MILAHQLTSRPDPFGQNLTQSARTKSDLGWFCTVLFGMSVEERNRVLKWETGSGPVASCQMIPAHRLASRPNRFGQTLTRPSRSDPGRFCTVIMIHAFFELFFNNNGAETDTLAVMPINGRNQNASGSDPVRLLGGLSFTCFPPGSDVGETCRRTSDCRTGTSCVDSKCSTY